MVRWVDHTGNAADQDGCQKSSYCTHEIDKKMPNRSAVIGTKQSIVIVCTSQGTIPEPKKTGRGCLRAALTSRLTLKHGIMSPDYHSGIDEAKEEARKQHCLKTWPAYFDAVLRGDKNFEIRYNKDRGFQKGDQVVLREYDKDKGCIEKHHYTGRQIVADISYVTGFEQKEGYVVFGLKNIELL